MADFVVDQSRKEFLSIKEVANRLSLHEMTIYRLIKSKNLPAFKVGGQWRIQQQYLENWLTSHTNTLTD
ncbi:MAG: helix-turn-helix domain-containing protein [Deltaproteobacteria bacterium]|nr:helix-turn-helix domain-containing protein [Deltaproteobacteria bacterium]